MKTSEVIVRCVQVHPSHKGGIWYGGTIKVIDSEERGDLRSPNRFPIVPDALYDTSYVKKR